MIPQGWEEKSLYDIAEITTGKWDANHSVESGLYKFYTCASEPLLCNTFRYCGDCLIFPGNGANVGDVYRYSGKFDAYQRTYVASNIKHINVSYLYYFLLLYWKKANSDKQYGSATNYIKIGNFKDFIISYPPLPEQERIVAKLDEAFEAIDKAKTIAETNLKNAKELFESALNNVFTKNTDDWEEKKLDDVCTYKSGTTISKDLEKDTGDLLYIKVGDMNIRGNEELITTSTRFASSAEISAAQIIPTGSVIFPKRGGAIATNKKRKIIKPTIVDLNTMAIIPNKELDSNFFYYWFGQINLIDISNGTTIPQINNYSFQNLRIKYPTLLEQQKIVEQLDKLHEQTQQLEVIYTKKIKECDELKRSILQKAFRGEL